jgi:RHS repeat-associated protein
MSSAAVSGGTTNYVYNALGQLIEKSGYEGTTILVYDEAGLLLGEYSSTGALIQETVWMGDLPVATLRPNGSSITVYYVHADHLGTPRKITNPSSNTVVWRWDPDTFGTASPSITTISYNLRFPGQYYLPETALYNNYFRMFDPQTGRYLESDPIGLNGGVNTYAYANENPIMRRDPSGLFSLNYAVSVSTADPQDMDPWYTRAAAALGFASVHGGLTHANHNRTRCTCTPQCNSWVLKGCEETIILTVSIATGLGPSMEAQVRSDEQQHVDDMKAAAGQIYAAGASAENAQKALMYPDQASCQNSAAQAVGAATLVPIQAAFNASKVRWDDSGLHSH